MTGIGGMGKTQLALEFAHRYGRFFHGGVFWISMADPHAVSAEVADCGGTGRMELRAGYENLSQREQVALVQAAWSAPVPRLLVFDNCEDEQLLAFWRPVSGGCRVLVTSRRTHWDPTLGVQSIPLGGLQRSGRLRSAMRYLRLALSIREQTLPAQHLATALTLNTLGEISLELGQFEQANTFHQRSYQMRLDICGERHWATAESVRNLGRMLIAQGTIEAGLEHLYRSVDIMVGCRGVAALDTARCYDQLAEALLSQGVAVEVYSLKRR